MERDRGGHIGERGVVRIALPDDDAAQTDRIRDVAILVLLDDDLDGG